MNVVGRVGSLISQGVYSVATPFHPFGGAIDVIVVQQQDGSFRSTPWYVRFGKFQGMLKGTEKIVGINVNGVEASFHMYLDHSGEAFFLREVDCSKECETKDSDCVDAVANVCVDGGSKQYNGNGVVDMPRLEHTMSDSAMGQLREECHPMIKRQIERSESEGDRRFHEIQNEEAILDDVESQASDSEVILVSVDGVVLTAPVSGSEEDTENVQGSAPQFQLGPSEGADFVEEGEELCSSDNACAGDCNNEVNVTHDVCSSAQDDTNCVDNTVEGCEGEGEGEGEDEGEGEGDGEVKFKVKVEGEGEGEVEGGCEVEVEVEGEGGGGGGGGGEGEGAGEGEGECEGEEVLQAQETQNGMNEVVDILTQRSAEVDDTPNVDAISNNIEVCEEEDEPIHQAQETENVENPEADICTKGSPEGDTLNVCISAKDDSTDIGNKIEVCEGEGEHQAHETKNVVDQEADLTQRSEEELAAIKRAEVFRSCVELPALVTKVQNTQKKQEKFKERDATEFRNNDELSPSPSSGYNSPVDSPSPELHTAFGPVPITAFGRERFGSDSPYAHSVFNDPVQGVDNALEGSPAQGGNTNSEIMGSETAYSCEGAQPHSSLRFEISLCGREVRPGMGLVAAAVAFDAHRVSAEEFRNSAESITRNGDLIVRFGDRYFTWQKAAPIVLGMAAFGLELSAEFQDEIPIKEVETGKSTDDDSEVNSSSRRWRLWQIPFRRVKTLEPTSSNSSNEDIFVDSVSGLQAAHGELYPLSPDECPLQQFIRTNVPSNEQIESLNLKEGQNMITFSFSTRVLGIQQVDAHIYLWKWNARIVISDVDGTITKSDVLGQFMPLVGKDWSQSGVAQLFSAIKENGYQLLFLSARAIVQAYLTRSFLLNLKQDGKAMPNGPVVISPDGLFPSLFREVIRRAPHEFKIACLEDIKKLFPSDFNPFYAGFGNRDTDELSYRKIGIPKGKIFIINPKGEVAISRHRIDTKSYTSLHTLVNDMFPPTSMVEQEDFNNWNYWRMPLPEVDDM